MNVKFNVQAEYTYGDNRAITAQIIIERTPTGIFITNLAELPVKVTMRFDAVQSKLIFEETAANGKRVHTISEKHLSPHEIADMHTALLLGKTQ
ncbi:MAG: hypothetical protein WC845_02755 [Candidatus Staskawiczbacteria bacterium]|jgi:hypothetical protein